MLADVEMEKKLLCALMLDDGAAIPEVALMLTAEDFYRAEHRIIYGAILRSYEENVEFNYVIVDRELERSGEMTKITPQYFHGILSTEYTSARAVWYVKELKEISRLRALEELGREISYLAKQNKSSSEVAAYIENKMERRLNIESGVRLSELLQRTHTKIAERVKSSEKLWGLDTGFEGLNRRTGGLRKSDLIILAARPAMGKTALALNIASQVALEREVLFFSLEMSAEQLAERLIAAEAEVSNTSLREGELSMEEMSDEVAAVGRLSELKMTIDARSGLSLSEIRMEAKRKKRSGGLDLIVIDYLQLMTGSKRYAGNRVQEVSEISRGLKSLAKDLEVPVLALSQLSRNVEMRADKRPQLADLRESGSIEQDADVVLMLYREEYYTRDGSSDSEIIVAKNRNGTTGVVKLVYTPEYLRFREYYE